MSSTITLIKNRLRSALIVASVMLWFALPPPGVIAPGITPQQILLSGTNDAPANISVYGDSISFGAGVTGNSNPKYANSWPGQLRDQLAPTYGNAGTGLVIANAAVHLTHAYDPRWSFIGPTITDTAQGFHQAGVFEVGAGSSLTFTCEASCVEFVAYLLASTSGIAQVQVDGGTVRTIRSAPGGTAPTYAPKPGYHENHFVTSAVVGTLKKHVLTITASGGPVKIFGLEARTGQGRIRVNNVSISGKTLASLGAASQDNDETGGAYGLPLLDTSLKQGPTVALIALGVNDWKAGATTATFTHYLNVLIGRIRADGATPVLYLPPQPSPSLRPVGGPSYTQYAAAYQAVSDASMVPFLNHQKLYAPTLTNESAIWKAGVNLGMYADTVHPTDAGSLAMITGRGTTPGIRSFLGV